MEKGKQRKFFGREITEEDIEIIRWILDTYKNLTRSELIFTISEALEWTRPEDGKPRAWQCRICLESLEGEGLIKLPAVREQPRNKKAGFLETLPEWDEIAEAGPMDLAIPDGVAENKLWRSYIEKYHALGYKRENGVSLRYFITSGDVTLGCMQFSSAAWALEDRDRWIGWCKDERTANLRLIANNTRYLLLPWAKMPNLASRALGKAARRIQGDWLQRYGYAPAMLETFVDSTLYKGTCYRAANWTEVGITKGRGRYDRNNDYALTKKLIFVYPLQDDFREVLLGWKPHRRMDI